MKKLKKILLINGWHFSKGTHRGGRRELLDGKKNGAGKSTVIDALQIVLLGETNARNFNQAANEKSQRTLDGYLRADMDEKQPLSRRGKVFNYIACEFQDGGRNQLRHRCCFRLPQWRQAGLFIYVGHFAGK